MHQISQISSARRALRELIFGAPIFGFSPRFTQSLADARERGRERKSDLGVTSRPFLRVVFALSFYETEANQIGTSKGDLQFDDRRTALRTKIIASQQHTHE